MELRASAFDAVAETYDRVRPSYPRALFVDLWEFAGAGHEPEILEVGAGTGKATAPLLTAGARVTAVELGPNLAAFLGRKFAANPRLRVVNQAFEEAELPAAAFDMVVAATAFHWLDPVTRLGRCHGLLRPGGTLAIIDTNQVASAADRGFFERCTPIYRRFYPDEAVSPLAGRDIVPPAFVEVEASGLFEDVRLWRYAWDQRYSTGEYGDLVRSYSNTQSLGGQRGEELVAELSALVDGEFEGYVVRPLVITLVAARRPRTMAIERTSER